MSRYALVAGGIVQNVIVANSTPTVPGDTVVALTANQAVGPGDSYDGTTFTPRVPSATEVTRGAAPGLLIAAYPVLKQWSADAQALYDAATVGNRNLTAAETREVVRRLGIFMGGFANILALLNLDGG